MTPFTPDKSVARIVAYAAVFAVVYGVYRYATTGMVSVESAASSLVAGVLLAATLSYVFSRIPFKMFQRVGIAWLSLFIIQMFSNLLEGAFFSTAISTAAVFLGGVLVGLLVTLVEAVLAGVLFPPSRTDGSLKAELREYFGRRSSSSWLWRGALCSLIYFPVYFAFGAIAAPLVLPHYTDPSFGLNLTIPGFDVIIPLEFLRGLLFVVALLPIMVSLKVSSRSVFLSVVALLYVPGAFVPFLTDPAFPVFLRVVHGLEILGDSIVYAGAIVYILKSPRQG